MVPAMAKTTTDPRPAAVEEFRLRPLFHLAFPVTDLEATRNFYVDVLGCRVGRSAARWIDFDFFGYQITAHLVERGRWVVLAALMWWIAKRFGSAEEGVVPLGAESRRTAWRDVAIAVAAVPLLWIAATWVVTALRFTLLGSWTSDGRVFVSPDYYRGLLLDLTPWLMASATLWVVRPHLE